MLCWPLNLPWPRHHGPVAELSLTPNYDEFLGADLDDLVVSTELSPNKTTSS